MKNIEQTPEFRALESVYNAMKPLKPESRRRIIEAVHTLLEISQGDCSDQQGVQEDSGPDQRRRRR